LITKAEKDRLLKENEDGKQTIEKLLQNIRDMEGTWKDLEKNQIDKDRFIADFQASIERLENDLKISYSPHSNLSSRLKSICEFIYKRKFNMISIMLNFTTDQIVLLKPNEQDIYEIFQKNANMTKYFLDVNITHSTFSESINRKDPIIGKIIFMEMHVANENNPYKLPKGTGYYSVLLEPLD